MSNIYRLEEEVVNNIRFFLNKASYNGLQEVQAVQEVLIALSNPIEEVEKSE